MKERDPLKTGSPWHSRKKEEIRQEETIAAISTPVGESGIGIVRMSGPFAEQIAKNIFRSSKNLPAFRSHQFHYGEIFDPETGKTVDEVMLVLMKSPRTYTREDIVEIQCHGGYFVPERVLELVVRQGARIAEPGEFTKRAFLNGRIDLTQAEAVIDLIKARTETSLELAQQQLKGRLYREVVEIKSVLIKHLALIEAHIDFPEEEIETISVEGVKKDLAEVEARLGDWINSFEEGRVFREGIRCAIVGRTNVGKSSLLNAMLKEERAIVTAVPGTTRDVIEEVLDIHGLPVRLIDTAGLRASTDLVEQEGVRRARERLSDADLALVVVDGSRPLEQDDFEIFREVEYKKKIIVMNKCDLAPCVDKERIEDLCGAGPIVYVSALRGDGIDELKEIVYALVVQREVRSTPEYLIVANVRHKGTLTRARDGVSRAEEGLLRGLPLELIAVEISYALDALGDLVGETTREDVLNVIFDQFCIGK